ncbi:hypothetical protein IGW14_21965 [Streptomyces hygroscopicus subsp. hygroscopicus]|uniref:hypothetical protein n=1 Tax=Streptomyces hygroscopicus TaxID=1912 RepID=UPI001C655E1A|nr:hypothetical protein [Streptomyces hygroscopicus]MBW8090615.1 hypothetical protein [Streptomyces hygroscopicus subsp. hygroscopicus]
MTTIEEIIRRIRDEMDVELRERARRALAERPRDWLVDQLLDRVLPPSDLPPPRPPADAAERRETRAERIERIERIERVERIRGWGLDAQSLAGFVGRYRRLSRERLEAEGLLVDPPPKGSELIGPAHRSAGAEELLREAKDLLYALLVADEEAGVHLDRVERALLTVTVPRAKAHTIGFLPRTAVAPEDGERAPHAPDTLLQVEYGEIPEELVGNGIAACLRLINNLEINEPVLYARMEHVGSGALE